MTNDGKTNKVMRRLAANIWTKIKDTVDDTLELEEDQPPNPPPKLQSTQSSPSYATGQNPLPTFGDLALSDNSGPIQPVGGGSFIGGFNPSISGSASTPPRFPASEPPNFNDEYPQQQSIFMQMALRPPDPALPSRPHSNPTTTGKPPSSGSSPPRPSATGRRTSFPSTPIKENKLESGSIAGAPKKIGQEQCSGVTKAGKRCTRMVKARPELLSTNSDDIDSLPRFCHQHSKELMTPSGYYSRKNGEWVKFEDWIPAHLHPDTQVSLRVEMERARSQSDVPGYIYTFEIRDPEETEIVKLKVGRAVNLVKRIDQWGKQCGSKEQVLRGFYPGSVEPDEASLMKGRVIAGEQGPWCHRLERLIHLELADLVSTCIYLDPEWPNVGIDADSETKSKDITPRKPCVDCGSVHKEIFEFRRWKRGKGREWDGLVKPVIERWGKFVELHV